MRRYFAGALLVLLVTQSSGAALATTPNESGWRLNFLAAVVDSGRSAIVGSKVYAMLTGTQYLYDAAHAPLPVITKKTSDLDAVHIIRGEHPLHPRIREGVRREFTMPPRSELDPRQRRLDPLAMRKSALGPSAAPQPSTAPFLEPLRSLVLSAPSSSRHSVKPQGGTIKPLALSNAGAGIEPWWTYQKHGIPGIGNAMVNVGTGNFIVSAMDADVHERGIDLKFQRVYNSQSLHDYGGDDGGDNAIFGNRWTNNFDANIVYDSTAITMTVYDLNGTPCTYTSDGQGNWIPCTGEHATLIPTDGTDCTYKWTQKNGTIYWFHTDVAGGSCGIQLAKKGHLQEMFARNWNNNITFSYSYYGTGHGAEDVSEIDANHSDGHSLIMKFGIIPGTSINELASVKRPDNALLQYSYDSSGNLLEVDKPGNNSANSVPSGHNVPSGDVPETYAYVYGTSTMQEACGPRCTIAVWTALGLPTDGAAMLFSADNSNRLTSWQVSGIMNFTPNDGTNTQLQSGPPTSYQSWYTASFVYGIGSACSNSSSGTTTLCDTDGHSTVWTTDSSNRITKTQTASSSTNTLTTTQTWDTGNNLTSFQNAQEFTNGTSTDITYDANGNVTQIKEPQVQTSDGSIRPTDTFTYDQYNNLTSACDAVYNATHNTNCPTSPGSGSTVLVYDTGSPDAVEPFGKVTDSYTATDYHRSYFYNYNSQSEPGDFGLPTKIAGDTINELDGTQITPQQTFSYDGFGNITTNGNGVGNWNATYDNLNRSISTTDPDGITSYVCYFSDDSTQADQTALQYKLDANTKCGNNSVSYLYDTDGDLTDEIHHFGGTKGDTVKWYDGLDRLVEAKVPADANIDNNQALLTRYLYDLTQNGSGGPNLQVGNSNLFHGYGNLYKTERYVTVNNNLAWRDANGDAYDMADRPIHRYQYTPTTAASGTTPGTAPGPLEKWNVNYDESNQSGLLTSSVDPSGVQTTYAYDAVSHLTTKSFSDLTPTATYTYDPDGHLASASNSVASDTYAYDADGKLQSDTEGTLSDPATLSYGYYGNGWRKQLTVSDAGASYSDTRSYSYRVDGLRKILAVSGQSNPFTWTHTPAGRPSSQSDPATGSGPFSSPWFNNGVTMGAKAESYDATTGLLSTLTMPDGLQYNSFTYDPEAEPTGFTVGAPPGFNNNSNTLVTGVQYNYDVRGELFETQATGNGSVLQNGYVRLTQSVSNFGHPACTYVIGNGPLCGDEMDANTGAAYVGPTGKDNYGCSVNQAVSYDANGRENWDIETTVGQSPCVDGSSVADKRIFDAEDHITSDTCYTIHQWVCSGGTYKWGPRGELRVFNGANNYTFHWDGNDLAFTTDQSNNALRYIEKLASTNSGQLLMRDRDFAGTAAEAHTKTGDSGVTVVPDYTMQVGRFNVTGVTGTWPYSGTQWAPIVDPDMPRTDGYLVGGLNVQGTRVYDRNLSQWITADAFKGDLNDPMSQWAYQWNKNNPITKEDARGYDPDDQLPRFMAPGSMSNGQITVYSSSGRTVTSLPYSEERARNGEEYYGPMGGTLSGTVVSLALNELGGPEVSAPIGWFAGKVIGYGIGKLGGLWCGYAQCDAPPEGWNTIWDAADLGGHAFEDDYNGLKTIAKVRSACFCLPGPSGESIMGAGGEESLQHIEQAVGASETSTQWANGNADPEAERY